MHSRLVSNAASADEASNPACRLGRDGEVLASEPEQRERIVQPKSSDPPATSADFERAWRRFGSNNAARLAYLRQLHPNDIGALFKVEMQSTMLAEILGVLCDQLQLCAISNLQGDPAQSCDFSVTNCASELDCHAPANAKQAYTSPDEVPDWSSAGWPLKMIFALTKTGRFALNRKLIGKQAQQHLMKALDVALGLAHDDSMVQDMDALTRSVREAFAL